MAGRPRVTPPAQATGNMVRDSALGLVPGTLDAYLALNRAVWESGPLGPAEIEIARLRNARRVGCVFCKAVRYDVARADGLDEARVDLIDDGYRDSALAERDKLIIAFTDHFLGTGGPLDESFRARLEAAFSAAELAHLSVAVAHFSGFSRCAVSLGGMPEELPVMEISVPA